MLPRDFGNWNTIWRTWSRWRDRGVWRQVMDVLRRRLRAREGRDPEPSLLMVDCQVVKGGRCGASFHEGHFKYRLNGAKRAIAVDCLGLPVAVRVSGARTHEVRAARELLADVLPHAGRVTTVMGGRGFRGFGRSAATRLRGRREDQARRDPGEGRVQAAAAVVEGRGCVLRPRPVAAPGAQRRGHHRGRDRVDAGRSGPRTCSPCSDGIASHAAREHCLVGKCAAPTGSSAHFTQDMRRTSA